VNTRHSILIGLIATSAVLTGCDSDSDFVAPPAAAATSLVRFIHASPDAPNVNVVGQTRTFVADLEFKEASAFETFGVGPLNVRVDGIVPGGTATVIGPVNLPLTASTAYSVIAVGEVLGIDALVIGEPVTTVAAGSVRAQVVHAAPNAPAVDVYVTAPGALLAQSAPLGTFAFGEDLGPVTVPAGDYRVRVTLPNAPGTVVFDSGTVALPGGADLLVVAVENTGPGAAPISLLVADGQGSFEILDTATPAELRVIHASPDAPAVDVVVNDDFANPVLENVPFPAVSGYLAVPPGTYNVKVTAANNPGAIVIDADVTLAAGRQYSVYATGALANIAPYVLTDNDRPVATAAKVRIVHTAPSAGPVDIYVTGPGAGIATATPAFSNVPFRAETGYVSLAGGSYEVTVTVAGTKTAAIGPATVTLADGSVYTAAARDATGGGAPFGLILLDDFVF
jgi:hypothetical protein